MLSVVTDNLSGMTGVVPEAEQGVALAARLFRGLGDPTRLALLLALTDGEQRVADLVARVGTSQPNVSGHLACLKACGLVLDRPGERRQVFYRIADPAVYDLLRSAEKLAAASATTGNPVVTLLAGKGE